MCELDNIESWRDKSGKAFGGIIFKLKRDSESIKRLENLTSFLDQYYEKSKISVQQRFYHVWFDFLELEVCPFCGLPRMFSKIPKFSIDRYGEKPTNPVNYYKTCMNNVCRNKDNYNKTKNALIEKYGASNPMEIPGSLEKIKENNQKNMVQIFTCLLKSLNKKQKKLFSKNTECIRPSLKKPKKKEDKQI
jgi:hypothetical protein